MINMESIKSKITKTLETQYIYISIPYLSEEKLTLLGN